MNDSVVRAILWSFVGRYRVPLRVVSAWSLRWRADESVSLFVGRLFVGRVELEGSCLFVYLYEIGWWRCGWWCGFLVRWVFWWRRDRVAMEAMFDLREPESLGALELFLVEAGAISSG